MQNLLIHIYDRNEQFFTIYDQTTTPMILAQLIQDANYYENFNLSEIFYFKIKDTEYYFANRNTPIYKYLSIIDKPILIFYKGLSGQKLLESSRAIEVSKLQNDNINIKQQKEILFSNTLNSKQSQQTSQKQSQQSNQKNFHIVEIQPQDRTFNQSFIPNMNRNYQSSNEGVYSQSFQAYAQTQQFDNIFQKIYEKSSNTFDASRQFSGTVKSEILNSDPFTRTYFNQQQNMFSQQQNNQQMSIQQKNQQIQQNQYQINPHNFKKDKYIINLDASKVQLEDICKFLKDKNIDFTIQIKK